MKIEIESVHEIVNKKYELVNYMVNNSIVVDLADELVVDIEEWLKTGVPTNNMEGDQKVEYEKLRALKVVNREYEDSVAMLIDSTPGSERETWIKQETEARAWLLDNSAYTPVINGIMAGREIEKEWLVNKIIEKADLYAENIGVFMGIRQKKEKEILGD